MSLVACGLNYQTTPLLIREKVAFLPEKLEDSLHHLVSQTFVEEAAILSTCHRTEWYCTTNQPDQFMNWLRSQYSIPHFYTHTNQAAVHHVLRVASGLDSQILGEPQILGQMKQAFAVAQQAGTVGTRLQRLFQHVFAVTKQVRTDTQIGAHPVSVAFAVVNLAKRIFTHLSSSSVLLIGAGDTIERVVKHVSAQGIQHLYIANRSVERAQNLAAQFQATAVSLSEIPSILPKVDIVVAAASNAVPLLGKGTVETAMRDRKHRPILMVDLAVPRNIEAEVEHLSDIYLYTVDDLGGLIEDNLQSRQTAAVQAEQMIEEQAEHFMRSMHVLNAVPTIRAYRDKIEVLRQEELYKAQQALNSGVPPEKVLVTFAQSLTNKIMHAPTLQMRQAAYQGNSQILTAAQQLFDIE